MYKIMNSGERAGFVISDGYAQYVQKSMAFGYVPTELGAQRIELSVEIDREMYPTRVVAVPPYDASGTCMHA